MRKEARTSFLKKRSKRLLFVLARALPPARAKVMKVFWFFFSKNNILAQAQFFGPKSIAKLGAAFHFRLFGLAVNVAF